mgnify:CR=1 FL=1
MFNLADLSRLKGFRFPRSVIGYAVWAYHRFALSLRDVEDLLAARGITVSYETVRDWVARFGSQFAAKIQRDRPRPADKWHLDESGLVTLAFRPLRSFRRPFVRMPSGFCRLTMNGDDGSYRIR